MSDPRKLTDLSRQELYDLIWSSPVAKVAADFGVTETVVKNHCNNRKVPRPTLRYWTKLAAGIKPRKKPLPPTPHEVFEIEAQRRLPKLLALPEPNSRCAYLLFPSPFNANKPREISAMRQRITSACKALDIGHVTPHGLRSYFVTQCRQSGLTDAEIAMLIGDKTGPALIAQAYGDLRPDHLLAQAQRIRLTASVGAGHDSGAGRPESMPTLPDVKADSPGFTVATCVAESLSNQR